MIILTKLSKNMRALIIDSPRTEFMQACDVFEPFKVLYHDIVLDYRIGGNTEADKVNNEDLVEIMAKHEFGDKLIALLGASEPKYINENIKVLSNGKNWVLLKDYIANVYKNR